MDTPNFQFASGSPYIQGERGTTAEGVKDIQFAIPPQIIGSIDFETDPIPGVGGGNLPWQTTTNNPHTGLRCFRSGAITNSQQSLWTFTPPVGAVNISFWWRVSSEPGFDFLEVYLNSVTPVNRVLQQSGTANIWVNAIIPLAGATSVIFRYVKDSSDSAGLDAVFIDDIEWISAFQAAIQNYEPLHLDTSNNLKVVLMHGLDPVTGFDRFLNCNTDSVTICQTEPFEVELVNNLTCETDSVTICTDAPIEVFGIINVANIPHVIVDSIPEVEIKNDAGNPIPVSGTITANQGTSPWVVSGTINIGTIPEIEIKNDTGNPIPVTYPTGTATNGTQVSTSGAGAVSILASNGNRKSALVQNISVATVRIGVSGVTATTGFARLQPGDVLRLSMPYCPTQELFMIREGAVNGTILVSEQT